MSIQCDSVMAFYNKHIALEPAVTLLVLSPQDWSTYTNFPVYGMPHYNDDDILIVASEDNDFWRSFIPPLEQLPKELANQIESTYRDKQGKLTMQPFFDLLAIHELGHAFHIQGGLVMQRKWMEELFANLLLHTYIAEKEPALLAATTIFPNMVVATTDKANLKFTTLAQLEEHYGEIAQMHPNNYGWYQCKWDQHAADIYDTGGVKTFVRLWNALKEQKEILDDQAFAKLLATQVHQRVADVLLKWNE